MKKRVFYTLTRTFSTFGPLNQWSKWLISSNSIGFSFLFFTRLFSEIKRKQPGKPGKFQNLPGLEIPGFTFLDKKYPAFLIF